MEKDWLSKVTWENGLELARLRERQEAVLLGLSLARDRALAFETQVNTRLSAKTAHLDALRLHVAEQDATAATNAREIERLRTDLTAIKAKLDTPMKASLSAEGIPWLMMFKILGGVTLVLLALLAKLSPEQLATVRALAPIVVK